MSPGFTRFVANLDAEDIYARMDAAGRRSAGSSAPRRGDHRLATSAAAAGRAAAFGTLCRVFLEATDRLWLPEPGSRLPQAAGDPFPRPQIESGDLASLEVAERTTHWAEPTEAAMRVNDRGFGHRLEASLGVSLPGSRVLESVDGLSEHLHGGGLEHASRSRWVLKAPFSAAGGRRVLGRGRDLGAAFVAHAGRLFGLHGRALFEPWVDVVQEFGVFAWNGGPEDLTFHRLVTDGAGQPLALSGLSRDPLETGLTSDETQQLRRVVRAASSALRAAGHTGPFGIDAYRRRRPDGEVVFRPLGEINARYTMGAVAWRAREHLAVPSGELVRWTFDARAHVVERVPE